MGDVSIIARRLDGGKYVQYGWGGNGGYFHNNGLKLLCWYDDPSLVEYLFGLGQLKMIGKPGSEKGGEPWYNTHMLDGVPHWLGKSEREIFNRVRKRDVPAFFAALEELKKSMLICGYTDYETKVSAILKELNNEETDQDKDDSADKTKQGKTA